MSRNILFRGFHVYENGTEIAVVNGKEYKGKWVCGDFCHPSNICMETIGYDEVLKQYNVPIWNDYQVIPETVCEFTGLIDKNGKKIFENDTLKAICAPSGKDKKDKKQHKCAIIYALLHHGFVLTILDYEIGNRWLTGYSEWGNNGSAFEVIGTIFDKEAQGEQR